MEFYHCGYKTSKVEYYLPHMLKDFKYLPMYMVRYLFVGKINY